MSAPRKVLLFVLDRDELRSHFNQLLARSPHAAFYAFDGADGFDRFLEGRPDVCLVCENTARISGGILCQLIREHRLGRGVGVYLLSAHPGDPDLVARARAQGITGVLPLPPEAAQLQSVLDADHAFVGPAEDGDEPEEAELAESTPPPTAEPVVVDADEVFAPSTLPPPPETLTLQLRAPAPAPEAVVPAVIELTPAMLKRAAAEPLPLPPPAPGLDTLSPDRTDPGPARDVFEPPEEEAPAPAGDTPAEGAAAEDDHPPFAAVEASATHLDPADLEHAALGLMGQPAASDVQGQTDPGLALPGDADPAAEEPTPVGERPAVRTAADSAGATDALVIAEEPTPVEQRPPVDIDEAAARSAAESSDVFSGGGDDGSGRSEVSGVFPLAPEERDSHTVRQAISESQLGGRLTRRILALYRLLDSIDYYQLLGVPPDADPSALQQAFHGLALEYHPDRFFALGPGFIKERVQALFMRMCEAYTVLNSSKRRGHYDDLLRQRGGAGPVPRYPLGEVAADQGDRASEAATPVGRKYLRLAFAALARGDLDAAHLNLSFAIGHEPNNAALRDRMAEIEQRQHAER